MHFYIVFIVDIPIFGGEGGPRFNLLNFILYSLNENDSLDIL